jgi:hypothetical protein
LTDAGKLSLDVLWDGVSVCGTDIRSTRPMAAKLLTGRTPEQVRQVVPLLFSVCGRAQGAAANAALHAARQSTWTDAGDAERMIVCEAMQEHLWRMMIDWPKLLGLPPQEQRFMTWYAMLRKIAFGEMEMAVFLNEFERDCLGMTVREWRRMSGYSALHTWWTKADSTVAQLLATLEELGLDTRIAGDIHLLPAWSANEIQLACAGRWNADFSARPDWRGCAAETGAWTYYTDEPLLDGVWRQSGSKALTRLLARIIDLAEMASGNAVMRLDVSSPETGEGIAVVRTARGLLMHHVCLVAEKVTDYQIVAPTEWNFHPDGVFAQDMRGLAGTDVERVQLLTHVEALSLDPCVAYEIEVRHA